MNKILLLIGAFAIAGAAFIFGGFGSDPRSGEKTMQAEVTPQTSLEELIAITPVAGTPKVLWARLPMGKISSGDRDLPGPTDLMLTAILDYGSEEEANAALADASGAGFGLDIASEPVKFDWWPDALLKAAVDGKLAVLEYQSVGGFGDGVVWASESAPRYLILRKALF